MFLDNIIKRAVAWQHALHRNKQDPYAQQLGLLRYQLQQAQATHFGRWYGFKSLLRRMSQGYGPSSASQRAAALAECQQAFAAQVPQFSYDQMYKAWWHRLRDGVPDLCWPGQIPYFAFSSGTTQADTKYIPVTAQMLRKMRTVSMRQLLAVTRCDLPVDFYLRSVLCLSGSTQLSKVGACMGGDVSGILAQQIPFWLKHYYCQPSSAVLRMRQWEDRLQAIVAAAPTWNIGSILGSPAWVQLLLERIISHYRVSHIHDIWPNLSLFLHGGVAMDSYRENFRKILGQDITYLETYLASEGFIAYQAHPRRNTMRLVLDGGLFYEFIPFESSHMDGIFPPTGIRALSLAEVELNKPYAILISNLSGLWRYMIGDVVMFHSLHPFEISIQGRTQHSLNFHGEHVSVGNLQQALQQANELLALPVREFTVFGRPQEGYFEHVWHIGVQDCEGVSADVLAQHIDAALQTANADYRLQRRMILAAPRVELLPIDCFYEWLQSKGKLGGQHKFPRVLKGAQLESWLSHVLHATGRPYVPT